MPRLARVAVGKAPSQIALAARTIVPPKVADDQELYERRALSMTWTTEGASSPSAADCRSSKAPPSSRPSASIAKTAARRRQEARHDPRVAAIGRGRARHARPAGRRRAATASRRSPTTLIVHLSDDAPPMLEGAGPISPETAERLTCDARRLTIKLAGSRPRALARRTLRLLPAAARAATSAQRPLPIPRLHRRPRTRSPPRHRRRARRRRPSSRT